MYILKIKGKYNIKVKKVHDFIGVRAPVNSKDNPYYLKNPKIKDFYCSITLFLEFYAMLVKDFFREVF